jgi:hypothetical protein
MATHAFSEPGTNRPRYRGAGPRYQAAPRSCSAFDCEVANPVLLPALFVVLGAERFLLSVTDCSDAIGRNPLLHQSPLYGIRAAGSQGDVVFLRAAFVTVAFDEDLDIRMLR